MSLILPSVSSAEISASALCMQQTRTTINKDLFNFCFWLSNFLLFSAVLKQPVISYGKKNVKSALNLKSDKVVKEKR